MATQSAPLVSLQAPKDVSLSQIEAELSQIWQMYNAANQDSGGAMRAATFTLIVYEPEETQDLLARLGFYQGPIDGIFGPQMEAAIKAAQKAYELPIDGKPSLELLNRLRDELIKQQAKNLSKVGNLPRNICPVPQARSPMRSPAKIPVGLFPCCLPLVRMQAFRHRFLPTAPFKSGPKVRSFAANTLRSKAPIKLPIDSVGWLGRC